jgi:hypothetical protein
VDISVVPQSTTQNPDIPLSLTLETAAPRLGSRKDKMRAQEMLQSKCLPLLHRLSLAFEEAFAISGLAVNSNTNTTTATVAAAQLSVIKLVRRNIP